MNAVFFDSHAHLDGERFEGELDHVLERAKAAGVSHIVCVGASDGLGANYTTLDIVSKYDNIFGTVGVHPHDARIVDEACMNEIEVLSLRPKVVAIGETGLDYHYNHSPKDAQISAFRAHLRLAKKRSLPVVIHTREAEEDTVEVLKSEGAREIGGVLHCFTGTEWLSREGIDLGFYISFSGVLTFRTAETLRDIARNLPRDRVLVETDCPFLAPIPFRGKRNEPSLIVHTARQLAELWNCSFEEVKETTGRNAARLFGISV